MAFLQPAPVLGRAVFKRLAHQAARLSQPAPPPQLCFSTWTSTATFTSTSAAAIAVPCIARPASSRTTHRPSLSVVSALTQARAAQQLRSPAASSFVRRLNTSSSKKAATAAAFDVKYKTASASSYRKGAKTKSSSFPETSSKSVAYWLLGSAASVFGIVVLGGLTRLTESGYASSPLAPRTS